LRLRTRIEEVRTQRRLSHYPPEGGYTKSCSSHLVENYSSELAKKRYLVLVIDVCHTRVKTTLIKNQCFEMGKRNGESKPKSITQHYKTSRDKMTDDYRELLAIREGSSLLLNE